MKEFSLPSWAISNTPDVQFYLEVLKDGQIIETIPLYKKPFVIFGRQVNTENGDVLVSHPSTSRQHATIVNRNDGALMIIDLESVQGTFVNNKKLEKDDFYRIFPGDIIRFAGSTRKYIVCGPEDQRPTEYDSINMENYRKQLQNQTIKAEEKLKKIISSNDVGISWGIADDVIPMDDEDEDDNNNQNEKSNKDNIPDYLRYDEHYNEKYGKKFSVDFTNEEINIEKNKPLIEKIRKKEKKIQNMQEEIKRIYLKESNQDNGLTEGQLHAIQRNNEVITNHMNEIQSLMNQFRHDNSQLDQQSLASKGRGKVEDEEEGMLDTTHETVDVSNNWRIKRKLNQQMKSFDKVISFIGLTSQSHPLPSTNTTTNTAAPSSSLNYSQIKNNYDKLLELKNQTNQQRDALIEKRNKLNKMEMENDIDAIVKEDRLNEVNHQLKSVDQEQEAIELKIIQNKKLLKLVTPALKTLVESQEMPERGSDKAGKGKRSDQVQMGKDAEGKDKVRKVDVTAENPPADSSGSRSEELSVQSDALDGLVLSNKKMKLNSMDHEQDCTINPKVVPHETMLQTIAQTIPQTIPSIESSSNIIPSSELPEKKKKKYPEKPTKLISTTSTTLTTITATYTNDMYLQGGDSRWIPPTNQTGDGMTKLNDKYGY